MNQYVIRLVTYKKNEKSESKLIYVEAKTLKTVMQKALKIENKAPHEEGNLDAETTIFQKVLL